MKIMVIGCTHAGTAAVLKSRALYPDFDITVYEKNDNISFLSCGIALFVGGIVDDINKMFYCSPKILEEENIKAKMSHEVVEIDIKNKKAVIKNMDEGTTFEDTFDKLIITSGSCPIVPRIEGINLENVVLCKNFNHAKDIVKKAETSKKIAIVGAGYIGVELAEAFERQGKKVILVDLEPRIMSKYLDKEFTTIAEKSFTDKGIVLALGEKVQEFKGEDGKVKQVVTNKTSYDVDMVVLCIGFVPNTKIFNGQLSMNGCGAIKVDEFMYTSDENVLAAGDCCTVHYNPSNEDSYIPLATNAVRQGTLAGINLFEKRVRSIGTQGTSGIKVYEDSIASTGITEKQAELKCIKANSITVNEPYRPEFMPTHENVMFKVVYREDDKEIIGAEILSKTDLTFAINTMSVCIQNKMKVTDLAFMDFFFQPHFNNPWSFVNKVGLKALEL